MADDPKRWLPPPQPSPWQQLASRHIYRNPWITVREDQVVQEGAEPGIYGVVEPAGLALGVVPVDAEGYTWLVGQYRYTLGDYSWEIPEGGGDPALDPVEEAARELREETGLTAASWRHLMTLHTSNCFTSERAEIYVATDLTPGTPDPDPTERLQVCRLPLSAAQDLARQGVITDAMSVAALLKLAG
ncbi:MAG: NUDIX hydrolase [Pseudomonadota bacterium]